MSNRESMIKELTDLIRKMDLPPRRKEIGQNEDLRWLKKSLPKRNAEHQNFARAMAILKEIV